MNRAILAALLTWVFLAPGGSQSRAEEQQTAARIKVLIVDGFSNHNWKLNTVLLRGILEPTGLFTVTACGALGADAPSGHTPIILSDGNQRPSGGDPLQ